MEPRDIYIRVTEKTGSTHIQERRVWDADRFLRSVQEQYKKEGGTASISTRDAYLEQRNRAKAAS